MNRFVFTLLAFWTAASCSTQNSVAPLEIIVPRGFRGPVYFIGSENASGEFYGKVQIPSNGVLIRSSVDAFKGRALKDLIFEYEDGSRILPADADALEDELHVWNVGLGTGKIKGEAVGYIVFYIGRLYERNNARTDLIDKNKIYEILHSRK